MSFEIDFLKDKNIKSVLHIGADRGNELNDYIDLGCTDVDFVEANKELFEELKINVRRIKSNTNCNNITVNLHLQLISDANDLKEFNIYYGPDAAHMRGNKGLSSLLKAQNSWWGSDGLQRVEILESLTLDKFCSNIQKKSFDLLNIDTQGAELMILTNGIETLKNVRFINCEVTFDSYQYENNPLFEEINHFLTQNNFEHISTKLEDDGRWGDALFSKIN